MTQNIIANWKSEYAQDFGKQKLLLQHRLRETGLFSKDALSKLIDRYPNELYNLSTMGYDPENPVWREGTTSGHGGAVVIDAIERGRMWLNLRKIEEVDDEYKKVLDQIFDEFQSYVPSFETFRRKIGVLISSPLVQVFYHADVPGQSLWQLEGEKRVYVYPNEAPFLKQENLESVILGETEEEIPYDREFDAGATVYDLKPGEMVHWPLNCPHRVENKDCLNISVTTEHWTNDIRKNYAVNYANGLMRRRFGMGDLSQNIHGPSVYAKAALALAYRNLKLGKANQVVRMIDFKVDPESDIGISDVPAFAKAA